MELSYDLLFVTLHVSTPVGDSLVVDWVFRSCVMTIRDVYTYVDLIILDMVDFDVILGIDWLSHYHTIMDYFAKTITLVMPGVPPVMWQGAISREPTRIISYVYARWLILRGCESYLAYICDTSVRSLSLDSVPIFCEFLDIFSYRYT